MEEYGKDCQNADSALFLLLILIKADQTPKGNVHKYLRTMNLTCCFICSCVGLFVALFGILSVELVSV